LQIEQLMFDEYKLDWKNRVSAYSQSNKLRTYKLLKHDFCTEIWVLVSYKIAYDLHRQLVIVLKHISQAKVLFYVVVVFFFS
jgi:hypothetical protein